MNKDLQHQFITTSTVQVGGGRSKAENLKMGEKSIGKQSKQRWFYEQVNFILELFEQ